MGFATLIPVFKKDFMVHINPNGKGSSIIQDIPVMEGSNALIEVLQTENLGCSFLGLRKSIAP